jgi:DNA-binding NarL/FixJ family response regulator
MKLLIVDDHAMVRQAISALLEREAPDTRVLQASGSAEGLELAARHDDLDAVFLDLSMPGMDGLAALREFGRRHPSVPVLVLSGADDPDLVRQVFAAGALGYVPKSATSQTLLTALQLVLNGETFVPSLVLRAPDAHAAAAHRAQPEVGLTTRQSHVLQHLGEGLSNKAIAHRMGLSEKTVKAHVTAVFRALSVGGRREAIAAARGAGLI